MHPLGRASLPWDSASLQAVQFFNNCSRYDYPMPSQIKKDVRVINNSAGVYHEHIFRL